MKKHNKNIRMKTWLFTCLTAMLTLAFSLAHAQESEKITVQGTIHNTDGEPLIGATVLVKGRQAGTAADLGGHYRIEVKADDLLVFRYIGYESQEVPVSGRTTINVVLRSDKDVALDEVVVIGYGAVKKKDLTGSVVSVRMSDIKDVPVLSVDQALQGRVAGADIMSTTGEPGATTSIRIRGTRSITASNEPLLVVDGVIDGVSDLADLNPADIESINILKDASATAIYGSRGSNGVILVTTKQGQRGKPGILFKGDIGFSQLPRNLGTMNATEFAQYRNDYAYFSTSDGYDKIQPDTPMSEYPYPDPWSLGEGTNWVDEITRTALYQNYALSLSGGSERGTYYTSLSYNNTRGIVEKSGLQRYTGRLNLDYQLFPKLKVGYKFNYTYRDEDPNLALIGGTNWWNAAIFLSPLLKPETNFNDLWYSGQAYNSPRAVLESNIRSVKKTSVTNTAYLDLEVLRDLRLRVQGTYYAYQRHTYQYDPSTLPTKSPEEGGTAYRGEYDEMSLLNETSLSYKRSFEEKHSLDAVFGFTAQNWKTNNFTLQGKGYLSDATTWNNMVAIPDKQNYSASTSSSERMKESVLFRLNYNFLERYYFTATGRFDGGSNFARNKKWGFFPSAALKWTLSNEPFMKDIKWIDDTSIRLSAGRTGNDGISAYRSLDALTTTTGGYVFNGAQPVAYYPSRLASPNLTWETTDLYNLAADFSFFNNRLTATIEGYFSYTQDLLLNVQTPNQTGYSSKFGNLGKTSNKGVELSMASKNVVTKDFFWSTGFSISHNKQMVEDIGTDDFVTVYSAYGSGYMMYGYVKDYPLNALWGFKFAGTWKNQEELDRNEITKAYVSASNSHKKAGSARYLDVNHDGILNENDLVYLGNADPWVYGGLLNTFRWKNLSLSVFLNYSLGGKIYNISEQWMGNGSPLTNQYRYMLQAWHPVRNPDSDIPRAGSNDGIASDRMVHSASYLRLKDVSVGYNFDLSQQRGAMIKDLQLTLSGENLYLWKEYNGFDPDVSTNSDGSTLRRVDIGAYPKARTVVFSVQIRY